MTITVPETKTRTSVRYAWFVVFALSLLQIGSYIDRAVINLLVEPMRRDFHINDTDASLLLGFAFSLFYAAMSVPIGRFADTHKRTAIIFVSVLFWSLATIGCMIAQSYGQLFVARMLVGLGEAALLPAGLSILSDYFRPGKLAKASACLTGASFIGSGIALMFGGAILAQFPSHGSISLPLVGETRSWQLAFGFASLPSLVALAAFAFVREPQRQGMVTVERPPLREVLAYLRSDARLWLCIFGGMSLLNAMQYGLSAWIPTFFIRAYGWSAADIGQIYGACFLVFAPLGTISGGALCDYLFSRHGRRAFLITALVSAILTIPIVILFATAGNATVSAWLLIPLTVFGALPFGAVLSAAPSLAPNRMRAQLVAAYMLFVTVLGQGGGPWLIALYTDYIAKDPAAIGSSIAVVSPFLLTMALVVMWLGLRAIPAAIVRPPST